MEYKVEIVEVQEQLMAASRQRTTLEKVMQEIRSLLDEPWKLIRAHPELRREGFNVAVYHINGERFVEVGIQILQPFEPTSTVVVSRTPAGAAAKTIHYGLYELLGKAHDAVVLWCKQNGQDLAGICWEVYGHWEDDPEKLRTDVYYLLK